MSNTQDQHYLSLLKESHRNMMNQSNHMMNTSSSQIMNQSDFRRQTKAMRNTNVFNLSQDLPNALLMSLKSMDYSPKLILYTYRWVILAAYCGILISTGLAMATTTSISNVLVNAYGIPSVVSNMCSLSFYITYVPFNFVSIKLLEKYGLRVCITVGAILTLIGAWVRMLTAFTNFYLCLVGSVIAASGQPMLLNCLSKLTTTWFGDNERAQSTAFSSMAIPLGCLMSFLLPSALFDDSDKEPENAAIGRQHFILYLGIQTAIITIFGVPVLFLMRDKPMSPPTILIEQEEDNDKPQMSIGQALRLLIRNKNYLLLFITFNFIYGNYSAMAAIMSTITAQYHYSVTDNSIICLVFLLGGIFNSFFLGSILDKYQNYKKLLIVICIGAVIFLLVNIGTLPSGNSLVESAAMIMTGAFIVPITSISYSFACELAYPVPEAIAIGMMITVSLIWSTILALVSQVICGYSSLYAFGLWAGLAFIATITSFFIKDDLRRLQQDDVRNSLYIEEGELRRASQQVRNTVFNSMHIVGGEKVKFVFSIDDQDSAGGQINKTNEKTTASRQDESHMKGQNLSIHELSMEDSRQEHSQN